MKKVLFVFILLALGSLLFAEKLDFLFANLFYVFTDEYEAYTPYDLAEYEIPQIEVVEMDYESLSATLYYRVGPDSYYIEPVEVIEGLELYIADETSIIPFYFDSRVLGEFALYFYEEDTVLFDGLTMSSCSYSIEVPDGQVVSHGFWTIADMQEEEILADDVRAIISELKEEYKDSIFN